MVICFDCSVATKAELDRLVQSGQYASISDVIAIAVSNLSLLHTKIGRGESIVLETSAADLREGVNAPINEKPLNQIEKKPPESAGALSVISGLEILQKEVSPPPAFATLPEDEWSNGGVIPIDRWVFGQHNRLLPAKFNCRILAHLLQEHPKGIELHKAVSFIANLASKFKDYLATVDARFELERDESLVTGFPKSDSDGEKSRLRYANQFVISVNNKGRGSGLLIDLKLVNLVQDKTVRVALTEPGWKLAAFTNPLLDGKNSQPSSRLTLEEQQYLLSHIYERVPIERFAIMVILESITLGAESPELLDSRLKQYKDNDGKISDAFLASQRSGAVARMCDLGLLTRVREGIRVKYVVTEVGKSFLGRGKNE